MLLSQVVFGPPVAYATGLGSTAATTADFNGDGNVDLATANYTDGSVSVLLNNGKGTFAAKVDYTVPTRPRSITAADRSRHGRHAHGPD
jgi:hypothetical protein